MKGKQFGHNAQIKELDVKHLNINVDIFILLWYNTIERKGKEHEAD